MSFKTDLSDSIYDFKRVVLPKMLELNHIEGEVYPVEEITAQGYGNLIKQFDVLAGIDLWQIVNGKGIKGLASRIQWDKNYQTFTIRTKRQTGAKTELAKRIEAIESADYLYPHYTLQAYVSKRREGDLLSYAIMRTLDLYNCLKGGIGFQKTNTSDGNLFLCVSWSEVIRIGAPIKIFDHQMALF